ncbi:Putative lipase/esterase/beta-lactamase [Mycobacteroides abscessus]|uniref:Esterase n=3 Tax=Mycobacteroides abscessus TaxID=36809 RepID=A0A829HSV6_9MYCO|nr:serine hydrolase domain-containing protein [Mycobacteroides abscessus]ESV56858.1 beta-lactamase family protein [Mycobacteroides abscessus MAB_082312_2258]ESV65255.1 beta-lactamase family protein [Mycobacteroides abscessus MAB_091912_2446]AIC71399.1 esterase [Mycobacteroides abscessus subsp. massiliense str. GO 06]AMU27762.1 esterase [Mycobacteroides abscessus]AMU37387.1 esterase [Mycobacteroides abscessus]
MSQPQRRVETAPAISPLPVRTELPGGVHGWAQPEFDRVVRKFASMYVGRIGGGALCVYVDGEPVLDIWAGEARPGMPWTHDTAPIVYSASKGVTATVIHRLADRGLLTYDAPVARYWPQFAANGKESITVRELLSHKSGLAALAPLASTPEELLDHELMEERLAAAPVGRFYGKAAYHAMTYGWLLAGLGRAITGQDMRTLYRAEIAEPLGVDGIHLGRPPADSPTIPAGIYAHLEKAVRAPFLSRGLSLGARVIDAIPAARGATGAIHVPGAERIVADNGHASAPLYDTQMGAGNAICTAPALAKLYAALSNRGSVDGRQLLSAEKTAELARGRGIRPGLPLTRDIWDLGYHCFPAPGLLGGFGHMGAGGSTGWADPKRRIAVGLAHNHLILPNPMHNVAFPRLWAATVRCAR